MKKKTIYIITGFMTVALLGLIALQVYWISHDLELKEQQFSQKVNEAINSVAAKLETREAAEVITNEKLRFFDQQALMDSYLEELQEQLEQLDQLRNESISEINGDKNERDFENDPESNDPVEENVVIVNGSRLFIPPVPPQAPAAPKTKVKKVKAAVKEKNFYYEHEFTFEFNALDSAFLFSYCTPEMASRLVKINDPDEWSQVKDDYKKSAVDSLRSVIDKNQKRIELRIKKLNETMQKIALEYTIKNNEMAMRIKLPDIDTLIGEELKNRGIELPYDFGVFDSGSDTLVMSRLNSDTTSLIRNGYSCQLYPNDVLLKPHYLLVNFEDARTHLLSSMWGMLGTSSLLTLTMIVGFVYTIVTMLRQKKLGEMKSDFINNMTHEFKTPIATISLAVDSINDPRVAENPVQMNYFTRIIKEENKRMNSQVEKVLQMAQIDKEELELRKDDLNIHDVILHSVEMITLQVRKKNGEIKCSLNATRPVIKGDEMHLCNVVSNLLDNANKYSPESPNITVETNDDTTGLFITVTDKGMGMTRDTQKKVFDKFYRVPTGNLHDIKGFGLGLSYVKAIVEKHKGKITVESELNEGSKFTVFLPYSY